MQIRLAMPLSPGWVPLRTLRRARFSRTGVVILALAGFAASTTGCSGQAAAIVQTGPYEGTPLQGQAADFQLVDHQGVMVRLSEFRGKVVALPFMDSQCQEVCPLTAVHLRTAAQELGSEAGSVVFLGVNVNAEANSVEDVLATTEGWRLDEIASWHFLTGTEQELRPVWEAYNVTVYPAPEGGGELVHTPGVFLIDQSGELRRYISTPFDDQGTAQWTAPLSELLVKYIRELPREG